MSFPKPVQGLVIRYSYLWLDEYRQGREEGVKDRPCAVILVTRVEDGYDVVTVLPITHGSPDANTPAVEIPAATKQRLGLDSERSWIVLNEANRFVWPGPDLRPTPAADRASVAYGLLPYNLVDEIRQLLISLIKTRLVRVVPRTE